MEYKTFWYICIEENENVIVNEMSDWGRMASCVKRVAPLGSWMGWDITLKCR